MGLLLNYFKLDNTVYLLQRLKILLQSFFVSKLGQRSRTQRWRENRKSKLIQVGVSEINSSGMSKAKLGSKTRDDSNEVILNEDFENHLKEIQKEWEGKRSVSHIRILLSQSRRGRNHWMSTLKAGKIALIFKKNSLLCGRKLCK